MKQLNENTKHLNFIIEGKNISLKVIQTISSYNNILTEKNGSY